MVCGQGLTLGNDDTVVTLDNSVRTTVAPVVNIANDGFDRGLTGDQRKLLQVGYGAFASAALAYVFSEDYMFYGPIGGVMSAARLQIDSTGLASDAMLIGGGVALAYYLKGTLTKPALILGLSEY